LQKDEPVLNIEAFISTTGRGIARALPAANGGWTVESLLSDQDIRCLAVSALNRPIVYAGTQGNGEVWQSIDHGDSWRQLPFNLGSIQHSMVIL
jgi:hypothetical protein